MPKISPPGRNDNIIDRFLRPLQRFNSWMQLVSEGAQTLDGTGSPEGVVEGRLGWKYIDTAASKYYIKGTEGGNTGWLLQN